MAGSAYQVDDDDRIATGAGFCLVFLGAMSGALVGFVVGFVLGRVL